MNFSSKRVEAHNRWPLRGQFKAEAQFEKVLKASGEDNLFVPFELVALEDADYQRCIGHLIDGLDGLPFRPDHMFDNCFRVVDFVGSSLKLGDGIKGIAHNLGSRLVNEAPEQWKQIIDCLQAKMPLRTYEFLAKRLLQAGRSSSTFNDQLVPLKERAELCFGQQRFNEMIKKYTHDSKGVALADPFDSNNVTRLAGFLKSYLYGAVKKPKNPPSHTCLNLGDKKNIPRLVDRITIFLSLLLFHVRNERSHGSAMSPFMTSKATIERYESFYFEMLMAYTFSIGCMRLRWPLCISAADMAAGCQNNVMLQKKFFKKKKTGSESTSSESRQAEAV